MNEFISAAEKLSQELLPILGVAVLICLMILLISLIKSIKKLNGTLDKGDHTIDLIDQTIEKAQAPLNVVEKVSKTVESVHDGAVEAVKTASKYVKEEFLDIKSKVFNEVEEETERPSNEDTLGK